MQLCMRACMRVCVMMTQNFKYNRLQTECHQNIKSQHRLSFLRASGTGLEQSEFFFTEVLYYLHCKNWNFHIKLYSSAMQIHAILMEFNIKFPYPPQNCNVL